MNYYLVKKDREIIAVMSCISEKTQLVPLHRPKTCSYFDDKTLIPISKERWDQLIETDEVSCTFLKDITVTL